MCKSEEILKAPSLYATAVAATHSMQPLLLQHPLCSQNWWRQRFLLVATSFGCTECVAAVASCERDFTQLYVK